MIKVTKQNISFGKGTIKSIINIDGLFIALCKNSGIEVYNKETQELTYEIPKLKKSHEEAVLA